MTAQQKAAGLGAGEAAQLSTISPHYITEIRREHILALQHADKAVDHAKRAGELLLHVKAALPHGEFLPWMAEHVNVTERQAQRYMRAALGKPLPISAISNTTPCRFSPPKSPVMAYVFFGRDPDDILSAEYLLLQESADDPGFYFAAFVSGDVIFTKKPIAEHVLEQCINSMLPGRLTGNRPISELNWMSVETDPYFVKN